MIICISFYKKFGLKACTVPLYYFTGTIDEITALPSLASSNFRCMKTDMTWCFINQTENSCPKCSNFTYVNITLVKCTRCESGIVDVLVNWTAPKTFSPISKYLIAHGRKTSVFGHSTVFPYKDHLHRPPVSSSAFSINLHMFHADEKKQSALSMYVCRVWALYLI